MHCIVCDLKSDRGLKVEPQKIRFFFDLAGLYMPTATAIAAAKVFRAFAVAKQDGKNGKIWP